MKKTPLLLPLLLLAACASPEQEPPAAASDFPPEYVISAEDVLPEEGATDGETDENGTENEDGEPGTDGENEETTDSRMEILACREQNAEVSLEKEAAERQLELCQKELAETTVQKPDSESLVQLNESHLELVKQAIISTEQPEYPFRSCGQVGTFIRSGWFDDFSTKLLNAKIRFSNGFLETDDLFGGCESTEGRVAFFLGAERESDIQFIIVKYDLDQQTVKPALMLDNAGDAVVTAFGKREGPFVNFPADDGRVFRYYYDANIVVEAP